ncbi:hypothetical protein BSL78_16796 [Apostichopus japonicus]|uniref:Reverse transcriptase domain-containing protein n=1 Tax=Stichopus japonicus TaxID=307972 RepID=A0A2G8KEB7_STIJA|nr:hypothetical protein BSL78_16796 [Apostichopus japonicus]
MGNVQSLSNKIDELCANVNYLNEFRNASLMSFTETWLTEHHNDAHVSVNGFKLMRGDRTTDSGKEKGGGVCLYVNENWCHPNHATIKHHSCSTNVEILTVSLRPYYLPREFSHVIVCTVYVPHRSAAKLAALELCDVIHELETASPTHYSSSMGISIIVASGKDAYNSIQLPALGNADHNLINLLPKYRPIVQRQKPSTVTVQQWNEDSLEHLRAELDATDWNAFIDAAGDLDELTKQVDEDYANELNCFYNRFDRQDFSAEHDDFQQQFANSDCDITVTEERFRPFVTPFLDPFQFAYQSDRSCEDAILLILHKLYSHLEHSCRGHFARVTFFDFSSAFNTIQPHILVSKLKNMDVPGGFIHWILNYLTNRTQLVKLSHSCLSDVILSNTGAPQGTVLAPFLFTLYTYDARSLEQGCSLIKFDDDTAMIGLVNGNGDEAYLRQIQSFVNYCDLNFLQLNVAKTKEMIIDFRHNTNPPPPVVVKGSVIDRVTSYKYLGVVLNDHLAWGDHIDILVKKLNSRLYCLRKMSNFNVRHDILEMFYNCTISGVWRYCLVCWGGNVNKHEIDRINSIIKKAERVVGEPLPSIDSVYHSLLESKLDAVWKDHTHPLYELLHNSQMSRGSGRLRLPCLKTNRYRDSFIPRAIKLFNEVLLR